MKQNTLLLCLSFFIASSLLSNERQLVIFASELDGVLIQRNWSQIVKNIAHIFYRAYNKPALISLAMNPFFWRHCYAIIFHQINVNDIKLRHSNHLTAYLVSKYPALAPYEKEIIEAFNEYKLNQEVIQLFILLKKINRQSYKVYAATNKNLAALTLTKQKVDPLLQKKFGITWNDLFDGIFYEDKQTVDGSLYSNKPKPYAEFFSGLWDYLNTEKKISPQNSKLIFIDGHKKNIAGARMAAQTLLLPIHAILFRDLPSLERSISNEFSS